MKIKTLFAVLGAVSFVAPAIAQTEAAAPEAAVAAPATLTINKNAMVFAADDSKVARVLRVLSDANGAPVAVKLIYNSKLITIPADTLTTVEGGVKTSLTKGQLKRM